MIPARQSPTIYKTVINKNTPGNSVYGLGLIGALVYFIMHATSFWMGVLGILKAIVWPAILVYEALKMLGA